MLNGALPTGRFVHPALFYRNTEEYLAGTVPLLLEGLTAGEPVAAAVPAANLKLLRAELGDRADEVHCLDMEEAGRNPGRIIPGVLRAFADIHPNRRVRIIGEPIWPGRSPEEYPACVQHEALINMAFSGRDVTILCPYDTARLDAAVLADARATHPVIVDAGRERASGAYDPERVVAAYNLPLPHPSGTASFPFDGDLLPDARHFAEAQARRLGLSEDRMGDLALAIGELITNSVVHAHGSGVVRVWAQDSRLVCEVRDAGRLTDPLAGRRPPSRYQPHGRGLLMVNHLADLVRLHSGPDGTTVRFYFSR